MSETEVPRWHPDEHLVPAILAGNRFVTWDGLCPADRAWCAVVLKDRGYTAEYTAEALGCSVRTVRSAISDATGQVMRRYLDLSETFDRDRRMTTGEVSRLATSLSDAERDRDRYQDERNRLIDKLMATDDWTGPRFRCGCPKSKYNTYIAPKTGKAGCRHHRALAQARYRQRQAVSA